MQATPRQRQTQGVRTNRGRAPTYLRLEQNLAAGAADPGAAETATAPPAGTLASLPIPAETKGEVSPEQVFRLNVISERRRPSSSPVSVPDSHFPRHWLLGIPPLPPS